uniref:Uncharacterized protein n=1 Tax=Tetranychus urticae TaxID=32264 RepID=T1KJC5_TETUR
MKIEKHQIIDYNILVQVEFNMESRLVGIWTCPSDVEHSIALLRLGQLFLDSLQIEDVENLKGSYQNSRTTRTALSN